MPAPTDGQRDARIAEAHLGQAIRNAKCDLVVVRISHTADGYSIKFRMGHAERTESGIDEVTLEDGPATVKIRTLVQKMKTSFAEW